MSDEEKRNQEGKVGLFRVMGSVLAAMFGVRGSRYHERDFTKGHPAAYIVVGIILTILFILVVAGVVSLVTRLAGT